MFFFGALKLTTIANATLFGTMAPLFALIIEWKILKRQIHRSIFVGIFICLFGSLFLHYQSIQLGGTHTLGNLLAIFCSLLLAVTYYFGKQVRLTTSTFTFTRTLFTAASITLFVVILIMDKPIMNFTYSEYRIFLLLGFIPTIFGHGILTYALKYYPTTVVTSIPLGEPIVASFFGWVLLNENITSEIIICGAIILIGLFLIIRNNTD